MTALAVRAALSFGAFLLVGSLLLLLLVRPGSPQFIITIASLVLGLALIGIAVPMARRNVRRVSTKEDS